MSQGTKIAEQEVPRFRALMKAGAFHSIYENAAEELKQATSEKDLVELLAAVTRKLGKLQHTSQENWGINYHTSGTFVTLVYMSTYQNGQAGEQFLYRIKDGSARLAGYHINSMHLLPITWWHRWP
jgi:hypothetical protein